MEQEISIMRDGLCLRGRLERPDGKKGPAAILFHGFTGDLGYEKDGLFSVIAERLNARGITVVRFDFNGHGKSDGDFSNMDVLNELEDAIAILKYVRGLDFVTDIYLLGHSQGGVVAGMLAGLYADVVKKLVLLAPAATLKDDAIKGVCMDAVYDTAHIPDRVVIGGVHAVGGHYFRIARLLPIYEVTGQYRGPALVIHGIPDAVVDYHASVRYGEVLENASVMLMEHMDHGIQGEDEEKALEAVTDFLSAAGEE